MKITMYELLGKIKDGKAPKRIRYKDEIYYLSDNNETYIGTISHSAIGRKHCLEQCLTDEVEILEEEKKIPEKVDFDISKFNYKEYELNIMKNNVIANTKAINQIIDYLDYIKSKGDE